MAIIIKEKNKEKYRIAVLGLLLFLVFLVLLWWGFLRRGSELPPPEETGAPPAFIKKQIDWQLLEDPRLEELVPFKRIPAYEEEIGRENPFIPY